MKRIQSLIQDIYYTVTKEEGWFTDTLRDEFSASVAKRMQSHLGNRENRGTLRLSKMGPQCPRALWFSVHHPELAEELPAWALLKYSYGHLIEAQTLMLVKASGHELTGEQDAIHLDGVLGHRDCVIDGCVVDVKSSASRSMQKFKNGQLANDDMFGYLDQLDGYIVGSADDPKVRVKDRGYILAVDKQLGHMVLYEHIARPSHIRERVSRYKDIVAGNSPPACTCGTVSEGASGNVKLDTRASYSPYKYCCFPNLRTFLYSSGPVYLTRVVRQPDVQEVDKYGQPVR
jgi:uncharacterized protein (DUF1810 family)